MVRVIYTIEIGFPDNVDAQDCAETWLRDLRKVRPEIIKASASIELRNPLKYVEID